MLFRLQLGRQGINACFQLVLGVVQVTDLVLGPSRFGAEAVNHGLLRRQHGRRCLLRR